MKRAAYSILVFPAIVAAFLAGSWRSQRGAAKPAAPEAREALHHADPRHSAHASDAPGIAPASGRPTKPVPAPGGPADLERSSAAMAPGSLNVSPEQQQLIGVRLSPVV